RLLEQKVEVIGLATRQRVHIGGLPLHPDASLSLDPLHELPEAHSQRHRFTHLSAVRTERSLFRLQRCLDLAQALLSRRLDLRRAPQVLELEPHARESVKDSVVKLPADAHALVSNR